MSGKRQWMRQWFYTVLMVIVSLVYYFVEGCGGLFYGWLRFLNSGKYGQVRFMVVKFAGLRKRFCVVSGSTGLWLAGYLNKGVSGCLKTSSGWRSELGVSRNLNGGWIVYGCSFISEAI